LTPEEAAELVNVYYQVDGVDALDMLAMALEDIEAVELAARRLAGPSRRTSTATTSTNASTVGKCTAATSAAASFGPLVLWLHPSTARCAPLNRTGRGFSLADNAA
jgi:hypothetical protein